MNYLFSPHVFSNAGCYTLTRVVQTIILVWLFAASYGPMAGCGRAAAWWGNFILFMVISVVQLYTVRSCLGNTVQGGWL